MKLGEEKELKEPFPMKVCYSKKNSTTFTSKTQEVQKIVFLNKTLFTRSEMLGKTLQSEMVFHNYGVSICNKIEGTNICFTELFKRITPKVNGYFTFESEVKNKEKKMQNHQRLTLSQIFLSNYLYLV